MLEIERLRQRNASEFQRLRDDIKYYVRRNVVCRMTLGEKGTPVLDRMVLEIQNATFHR